MKQNSIMFWLFLLFIAVSTHAQEVKTVKLDKAGTLKQFIPENEKCNISELIISGELNGADMLLIREMAGCDKLEGTTPGTLKHLNLLDATILDSNIKYTHLNNGFVTEKDVVGGYMFYRTNLKTIILPRNIKSINIHAFGFCQYLEELILPEGLEEIGNSSFVYCSNLKSVVLPESLKRIGVVAFSHTPIESIVIPEGVTEIDDHVFFCCAKLAMIRFPSSLHAIRNLAFDSCISLTEIVLPPGLKIIESDAFYKTKELRQIIMTSLTPPDLSSDSFEDEVYEKCRLLVPKASLMLYKNHPKWSMFKRIAVDPLATNILNAEKRKYTTYSHNSCLVIKTDLFGRFVVFDMNGYLMKDISGSGIFEVPLKAGLYIVSSELGNTKVLVK